MKALAGPSQYQGSKRKQGKEHQGTLVCTFFPLFMLFLIYLFSFRGGGGGKNVIVIVLGFIFLVFFF